MSSQAGIVRPVIQLLLPLLAFCAVTGRPTPCESQESAAKNETPTFGLTGGQILIGKLEEKELSILTKNWYSKRRLVQDQNLSAKRPSCRTLFAAVDGSL